MRTSQKLRHTDTSSEGDARLAQDQMKLLTLATIRALNARSDKTRNKSSIRKHLKRQKTCDAKKKDCIELEVYETRSTVDAVKTNTGTDTIAPSCSYTQQWSTAEDDDDDYLLETTVYDVRPERSEHKEIELSDEEEKSQRERVTKRNKNMKNNLFELFSQEDETYIDEDNDIFLDGFGNELKDTDTDTTESSTKSTQDEHNVSDMMSDFSWAFTDNDKDCRENDILGTCREDTFSEAILKKSASDSQVIVNPSFDLGYGCFSLDEEMEIQRGHIKGLLGKAQIQAKKNRITRKYSVWKSKQEICNVIQPIRRRKRIARPIRDALLVRSSMQKALKGCIGSCCGRGCWAKWKWTNLRHVMSDYE